VRAKNSDHGLGVMHHSKPSHRESPRWTWHAFTREEYRYKFWDYAKCGNVHNKTLGDILGKHPHGSTSSVQHGEKEEDWWEHSAARNRERR